MKPKDKSEKSLVLNPLTPANEPAIAELGQLINYVPRDDGSHQRLGISLQGLPLVIQRIGLIQKRPQQDLQNFKLKEDDCLDNVPIETAKRRASSKSDSNDEPFCIYDWQYAGSYRRSDDVQWLDGSYGPLAQSDNFYDCGTQNMTGYDVADGIRQWLVKNKFEKLSICEVVLVDPRFEDLRKHVGPANVFWSHMQQEPFLGQKIGATGLRGGTLANMAQVQMEQGGRRINSANSSWIQRILCVGKAMLPPKDSQRFWLDYTSLRQMQDDFKAENIAPLVKEIGSFVASIDADLTYSSRSFCVLEVYAAALAGLPQKNAFVCSFFQPEKVKASCPISDPAWTGSRNFIQKQLKQNPINTKAAKARREKDKALIDGFIVNTVGFEKLDSVVTQALIGAGLVSYAFWLMLTVSVFFSAFVVMIILRFTNVVIAVAFFLIAALPCGAIVIGTRNELMFGNAYARELIGAPGGSMSNLSLLGGGSPLVKVAIIVVILLFVFGIHRLVVIGAL